jgi:hypothetical protein
MWKKILFCFLCLCSFFSFSQIYEVNAECKYNESGELSDFLDDCKPDSVVWTPNMKVEDGFKEILEKWVVNISLVLWIFAVGSLVYGWFLLQLSAGEDEKIKKAKNIIKWTLIWFVLMISASGIIYLVIQVFFWLW